MSRCKVCSHEQDSLERHEVRTCGYEVENAELTIDYQQDKEKQEYFPCVMFRACVDIFWEGTNVEVFFKANYCPNCGRALKGEKK